MLRLHVHVDACVYFGLFELRFPKLLQLIHVNCCVCWLALLVCVCCLCLPYCSCSCFLFVLRLHVHVDVDLCFGLLALCFPTCTHIVPFNCRVCWLALLVGVCCLCVPYRSCSFVLIVLSLHVCADVGFCFGLLELRFRKCTRIYSLNCCVCWLALLVCVCCSCLHDCCCLLFSFVLRLHAHVGVDRFCLC